MTGIKDFFAQKKYKKIRKDQWLILFLAGILLLIIALPSGCTESITGRSKEETKESETVHTDLPSDYEQELESRLEEILSGISGAGRVRVMITFRDSGESVVEKDVQFSSEEQNSEGTDKEQTSIKRTESTEQTVYDTDSREGEPFVRMQKKPAVEGVLVVAECGEHTKAASDISEAIQALFGLDAHKIKVVKMNTVQEGTD